MQIVSPDFQKIPLRIHQNIPFQAKKSTFYRLSSKCSVGNRFTQQLFVALFGCNNVDLGKCSFNTRGSTNATMSQVCTIAGAYAEFHFVYKFN